MLANWTVRQHLNPFLSRWSTHSFFLIGLRHKSHLARMLADSSSSFSSSWRSRLIICISSQILFSIFLFENMFLPLTFYSNVYVPPKSERVKGKPTHGVNLPSPTNLLAAHSSSAFFVALFSGKTRVRSVVPSLIFLGLSNEQGVYCFF